MAELSLYVDLDRVSEVREFVGRIGEELGLDSQVIFELQLAVEEACSNVVFHAYDGQGGNLEVSVEPVEGGVQVVMRDWGAAFDPEAVRRPDVEAPLDQRPLGGLGLHIMRQVMDRVDFRFGADEGNTLTLVKHCERANGLGAGEGC